jgi:hypothetical protein
MREIIPVYLADNTRARVLDASGQFQLLRPAEGEPAVRCQQEFLAQRPEAVIVEPRDTAAG